MINLVPESALINEIGELEWRGMSGAAVSYSSIECDESR